MVNAKDIIAVLADVEFPQFDFIVGLMGPDGYFLQVEFKAVDHVVWPHADVERSWTGRKWYISAHSTVGEIVQTALKAVLTAIEHEAREQFKYKGVAIFQPHINPDALVEIAVQKMVRSQS